MLKASPKLQQGIYISTNIQWLKSPSKSLVSNNPIENGEEKINLEGALHGEDERALNEKKREAIYKGAIPIENELRFL